ncbi:hypothetical protein B484DRAFT_452386, partial [Ochromonadaceae sp. CCMP2298]
MSALLQLHTATSQLPRSQRPAPVSWTPNSYSMHRSLVSAVHSSQSTAAVTSTRAARTAMLESKLNHSPLLDLPEVLVLLTLQYLPLTDIKHFDQATVFGNCAALRPVLSCPLFSAAFFGTWAENHNKVHRSSGATQVWMHQREIGVRRYEVSASSLVQFPGVIRNSPGLLEVALPAVQHDSTYHVRTDSRYWAYRLGQRDRATRQRLEVLRCDRALSEVARHCPKLRRVAYFLDSSRESSSQGSSSQGSNSSRVGSSSSSRPPLALFGLLDVLTHTAVRQLRTSFSADLSPLSSLSRAVGLQLLFIEGDYSKRNSKYGNYGNGDNSAEGREIALRSMGSSLSRAGLLNLVLISPKLVQVEIWNTRLDPSFLLGLAGCSALKRLVLQVGGWGAQHTNALASVLSVCAVEELTVPWDETAPNGRAHNGYNRSGLRFPAEAGARLQHLCVTGDAHLWPKDLRLIRRLCPNLMSLDLSESEAVNEYTVKDGCSPLLNLLHMETLQHLILHPRPGYGDDYYKDDPHLDPDYEDDDEFTRLEECFEIDKYYKMTHMGRDRYELMITHRGKHMDWAWWDRYVSEGVLWIRKTGVKDPWRDL